MRAAEWEEYQRLQHAAVAVGTSGPLTLDAAQPTFCPNGAAAFPGAVDPTDPTGPTGPSRAAWKLNTPPSAAHDTSATRNASHRPSEQPEPNPKSSPMPARERSSGVSTTAAFVPAVHRAFVGRSIWLG